MMMLIKAVCTLCLTGNLGDEQHVVSVYPTLQEIIEIYNGLYGDHAATMVHEMIDQSISHDTRALAQFIKEWLHAVLLEPGYDAKSLSLLDEWLTHSANRALGSSAALSKVGQWPSGSLEG